MKDETIQRRKWVSGKGRKAVVVEGEITAPPSSFLLNPPTISVEVT